MFSTGELNGVTAEGGIVLGSSTTRNNRTTEGALRMERHHKPTGLFLAVIFAKDSGVSAARPFAARASPVVLSRQRTSGDRLLMLGLLGSHHRQALAGEGDGDKLNSG